MGKLLRIRVILFILLSIPVTLQASGGPPSGMRLPDAEYDNAVAEIKLGHFEIAISALEKVIDRRSDDADAYNWLGYAQRKLRRYGPAEKNYLEALKLDKNHRGAREYLGELYVETGLLDKARQQLAALERLCPDGCEERRDLQKALDSGTTSH